jgi:hypothetical protein
MHHQDNLHPDEFDSVVAQLRAHRPEATALELDAIKRRVRGRVTAEPSGRRARSATLMKSRLAVLLMLVLGLTMSTAGAGLAIDGLSSNDASVAQYGPGKDDNGGVLGEDDQDTPPAGDVAGQDDESGGPLQPTRQVEAGATGGDTLPFTGFLAIPVLIGGVALLSTGLILRRRGADDRS